MGQCLSAQPGVVDAGEAYKFGGLGPYDGVRQYGGLEQSKPAYAHTADVGMKPARSEDKPQFGFMQDKPAPLQLDRIEEDATFQGGDISPTKAVPLGMPASEGSGSTVGGGGGHHAQRKPSSWTRGELIGQGAYGSVYVAMDNDTGELIAVKQVHVPRGGGAHAKKVEDNLRSLQEEVQLLQDFDHPNIVRYLGTDMTEDSLNIFLEYVPGGSIASLLAKFGSFKESVIKVYTKQILLGLEYLHSKGVMHRDIKGANILVDNMGLVKLADFGASKKLEDLVTVADGNKSVRGTPYWMAPEVITQTGHGRQADLWSVACTVLEMATGRPPWSTQYPSQVAAMFHIASTKGPPEIPQHLTPECKDFLYLCFNRDWKARPLAATLLRHPFLADVALRSHAGGPSPNAAALVQAWRAPRTSGLSAAAASEASDSQFGTPSPLNPKLAGMTGGAARISLQTTEGGGPAGEGSAALSPLGHHAAARRQQWDSAALSQQQQQQQAGSGVPPLSRETSGVGRAAGGGSPIKRAALSLRASAPVFSGYASVALSQQSELSVLRPTARPAAAAAPLQEQLASSPALRGSRESALSGAAASSAATGSSDAASQREQQQLRRSGSGQRLEREVSSHAPAAQVAADPAEPHQHPPAAAAAAAPVAICVPHEEEPSTAAAADVPELAETPAALRQQQLAETPAALRQRLGVQDLLGSGAPRAVAGKVAEPNSAGNSSGTNKSDYNPMEEPSWMHPHESPLPGEGTPTSAVSGGASPPHRTASAAAAGPAASSLEVSSFAAAAGAAPLLPAGEPATPAAPADAMPSGEAAAEPAAVAAAAVAGYDQHPSTEHMVWTNEDGDIDALPWDMGGWSTGSSGERGAQLQQPEQEQVAPGRLQQQPQQQQQQQAAKVTADPVDEDALIGALRRKAHHDVRASMALFEKSLNIPAVHAPPSPKGAAAALGSCSPRTIAAVRAPAAAGVPALPEHPVPAPVAVAPAEAEPTAESIESMGAGGQDRRQSFLLQPAFASSAAAAADSSRRHAAAVQHLLSGARPTATGVLPPPSPLQAAVGGLAELGYASSMGQSGAAAATAAARCGPGGDRESIWQQELSQELFRVKASTAATPISAAAGGVPNRRVSMHGSPLKSRLHGLHP